MMMRWKLANKLQKKRMSLSTDQEEADTEDAQVPRRLSFVSPLPDRRSSNKIQAIQPKRISLCSEGDKEESSSVITSSSSASYGAGPIESPVPSMNSTASSLEKMLLKPMKLSPPSDICFAPIRTAGRRLDFDTPTTNKKSTMVDGIDHSYSSCPSQQDAAIVSPRVTPDCMSGPSFEEAIKQEVFKPKAGMPCLPSPLYIPTKDEHQAADILMGLRGNKVATLEDGPLVFTPPKRRRTSAEHTKQVLRSVGALSPITLLDDSSVDEEFLPPKKRRKHLARSSSSSKKHSSTRRTRLSVAFQDEEDVAEEWGSSVDTLADKPTGMRLAMPDDPQELNSLHCFVRSDLLEVFAMDEDSKKHNGAPKVGLRCVHCGHLPRKDKEGASMSTFYPKSLQDIYRGVCTWQRIHFKACKHVPHELVDRYNYLKEMDRTRGKKQHWIKSAFRLGLRNFDENRGGIVWDPEEKPVQL